MRRREQNGQLETRPSLEYSIIPRAATGGMGMYFDGSDLVGQSDDPLFIIDRGESYTEIFYAGYKCYHCGHEIIRTSKVCQGCGAGGEGNPALIIEYDKGAKPHDND